MLGTGGIEYFRQLLDPLRHVPPAYVLDIESRDFEADEVESLVPDNVAGIAVVSLGES